VPRYDPYAMEVDHGKNCYSCGEFGYLAKNYRNWEIIGRRRLEYGDNSNNGNGNLNGEESLIVFD